ncbi:MAG: hypothetical protein LBO62_06605 [Endomicrobium sp.]|jgi:hypothetical protein|nr:hypothetical protein [Endomicrobium sp.]
MNKKNVFTILIAGFLYCASVFAGGAFSSRAFAAVLTQENNIARFRVEISFENVEESTKPVILAIEHSYITRVSVNMRTLVATGSVKITEIGKELGLDVSDVYLQYQLSDDAGNIIITSAPYKKVNENLYSFVSSPIVVDRGGKGNEINIDYRIVAKDSAGGLAYYPSSSSYITAEIKPIVSGEGGMDGKPFVLQSGDQTRGDTSMLFYHGALISTPTLIIQELYTDKEPLPSIETVHPIITYFFSPPNIAPQNNLNPVISLYYGDLPADINDIEVRWFDSSSGKWKYVKSDNDTVKRTATVNMARSQGLGYYAIFIKSDFAELGFGPDKRVITPHEKIKFRGLQEGDIVKIYNSRGKNIATLDREPFEWDASYNGGGKVETGSYIFQIKKDGKTTSGTVVVVR